MGKAIEAKNLNIYYGSFLAVEGVSMTIRPQTVTALIGPSGCGKSTFLRSINRMHEVIPGARVEGSLELDGNDLYGAGRRPGRRAAPDRHGLPAAQPVPHDVHLRQRDRRAAAQQQAHAQGRHRRAGRAVAARREPVERGQGPAGQAGFGALGRSAAAAVHRPRDRRAARRAADGRAVLGPRPDLHARDRGPDQRAEERVHDRHRHPQHAAGGAGERLHRVLQHRGHRQARPPRRDGRHQDDLLEPDRRRRPRTTCRGGSARARGRRASAR